MNNAYCLYTHTNKINGKKYVGITCKKPEKRWGKNGNGYIASTYFWSAIQKYGWDNFEHEILFEGLSQDEAFAKEKEMIKYFQTQNPAKGYNIADGGQTGPALFGEKNPNYGKQRSKEHCEHLSKALIGHSVSNETKRKISENNAMSRSVLCVELNRYFSSISEAA